MSHGTSILLSLIISCCISSHLTRGQTTLQQCEAPISWDNETFKEEYTVGVLAIRGIERAYEEFEATFSDYLTATAGTRFSRPVAFRMKPLNFLLLFSDTQDALVDFFYVNPSAFSCIESEFGAHSLASIISDRNVDGKSHYLEKFGGVIFTQENSTINSVYDLKDKSVAAASISGLGSGQMQFRVMQQAQMSYINDPMQLVFTSNQGKVVQGVLNGDFDAGFVRTDQIEQTVDPVTGEPVDRSLFKIIDPVQNLTSGGEPFPFVSSTQLYPEWNIGALPHVPSEVSIAVQDAMLSLEDHATIGQRLVECYEATNCEYLENLNANCVTSCNQNTTLDDLRCDTTVPVALLAYEAKSRGKYKGWRSTLSYMELRNMQEETGFITKNETTGIMQCIRSAKVYDAIVCPKGYFKKSEREVESGCADIGMECKEGYQCVCKPCVKAFDIDIFPASSVAPFSLATSRPVEGCPKFEVCGFAEQLQEHEFIAVDNKKRGDLDLRVRLHDELSSHNVPVEPVPGANHTFKFNLSAARVGVVIFEITADGEQISESPLRMVVQDRDCADEMKDPFRIADDMGLCVCSSNSVDIAGRCVAYSVLFPAILLPLVCVAIVATFLYVERQKKMADSVWAVRVSELNFDDPPVIIGRGTFGLVLLGEYRGTQVAVKRVIPPKFECKEKNLMRVGMLGYGDRSEYSKQDYSDTFTGKLIDATSNSNPGVASGNFGPEESRNGHISKTMDVSTGSLGSAGFSGIKQKLQSEGGLAKEASGTSLALPLDETRRISMESISDSKKGRRNSAGSVHSEERRLSWGNSAAVESRGSDFGNQSKSKRRSSFLMGKPKAERSALDKSFDFSQEAARQFESRRRSSQAEMSIELDDLSEVEELDNDGGDLEKGGKKQTRDADVTVVQKVHSPAPAPAPAPTKSNGANAGAMSGTFTKATLLPPTSNGDESPGDQSGWGSTGKLSVVSSGDSDGEAYKSKALTNRGATTRFRLKSFFRRGDEYKKLKTDFILEMRHLSKLRHPCITTVMGAVTSKSEEPMLVMEYMDHGSLYDILHNETMVVDGELVLPILRDIAQGVRFLHTAEPQVIHGDLKAQNVLVDGKFRAKVADFGLSQKKKIGATGTPYWMAPELLRGESDNTAASDVFSFGIILYEVYSRKDPYEGERYRDVIRAIADPMVNKRPPVPKSMPPAVVALMSECLSFEPSQRPTFEELDQRLKRLDVNTVEPGKLLFSHQLKKDQMMERTSQVFEDLFPRHVAQALREGRKVEAEHFDLVTIFFSDIIGFTNISTTIPADKVSDMLDRLYVKFDDLSEVHDVFKIETIGDAYICVTNLLKTQEDHAARIARFSVDAIKAANETLIHEGHPEMGYVNIRVGFHSGPVVANVVGSRHPKYTIFGDTVNVASRMESNSLKNRIQCSDVTAKLIREQDPSVLLNSRGTINVKGKGEMSTFWINEAETPETVPRGHSLKRTAKSQRVLGSSGDTGEHMRQMTMSG